MTLEMTARNDTTQITQQKKQDVSASTDSSSQQLAASGVGETPLLRSLAVPRKGFTQIHLVGVVLG